jgi:16S rRNA (cytosine1402-N4)-methyltransferase
MSVAHVPVMPVEMLEALNPKAGGTYLDGTFGRGGYSRAILDAAACTVWAVDCDPEAIARGQALIEEYAGRLSLLHGRFGEMVELLQNAGVDQLDGVVLDLGVSSPQLDDAARGFSFRGDGPLDMRMTREGQTAADIVNTFDEKPLADLIHGLGEERHARRVARAIVAARIEAQIDSTLQLAKIVRDAVSRMMRPVLPPCPADAATHEALGHRESAGSSLPGGLPANGSR